MAVAKIEEHRQQDGSDILKVFLKPTRLYPAGSYFYCDAKDIDLVKKYTWSLRADCCAFYISANNHNKSLAFHRELALKELGNYIGCIDHRNGVGIDNVDANLFNVDFQMNSQNKQSRGYFASIDFSCKKGILWRVLLCLPEGLFTQAIQDECDACRLRYRLEQQYYTYCYDFLKDRRDALEILDLERTGKISADEATYHHIMKYADNAWYYYRYGLEEYFKDNNIPVPSYSLDEQGFMVHPITGQKLCPFTK